MVYSYCLGVCKESIKHFKEIAMEFHKKKKNLKTSFLVLACTYQALRGWGGFFFLFFCALLSDLSF